MSKRHGLTEAAGITDLIKQHNEVQQQITAAKHRAAQLEVVADLEKRQAHFEACLSAGACMLYPPGIPACTAASSTGHDTRVCMSSWLCCSVGTTVEQCFGDDMLPVTMHTRQCIHPPDGDRSRLLVDSEGMVAHSQQPPAQMKTACSCAKGLSHCHVHDADEYRQAADCLQSLLEFSQTEQGSAFPDFEEQCQSQVSALQEVPTLAQASDCALSVVHLHSSTHSSGEMKSCLCLHRAQSLRPVFEATQL